jgi:hypothetical protein
MTMNSKNMIPMAALGVGAAVIIWLLNRAQPSSPAAWLSLSAVVLLPYILAAGMELVLAERASSKALTILAVVPMLFGLAISISPFLGEPDAQGGLALFFAPVVQLIVLGIVTFFVTRRM